MISSYFMHIYARKIKDITVFTQIICNLVHIFGIAQYCQLLKVPNTPGQVRMRELIHLTLPDHLLILTLSVPKQLLACA